MNWIFRKVFSKSNPLPKINKLLDLIQKIASQKGTVSLLESALQDLGELFNIHCALLVIQKDERLGVQTSCGFSPSFTQRLNIPIGEGKIWDSFSKAKTELISRKEFTPFLSNENISADEFLSAPLSVGGQTLGVFLCAETEGRRFNRDKMDALDPYLKILSVGLWNAQNFERIEKFNRRLESEVSATTQELAQTNSRLIHRVRELKALYELTLASGTVESTSQLFENTTAQVQDLFDVEHAAYFVERTGQSEEFELMCQFPSFGLSKEVSSKICLDPNFYRECSPALKTVVECYRTRQVQAYRGPSISLQEALPWKLSSSSPDLFKKVILRSLVAFPLQSSKRVLGVMVLANFLKETQEPSPSQEILQEEEIRTLMLIASRVASSMEAFQMDRELENRMALLSTLQEISEVFYTNPLMELVLDKVMEIIKRSVPCDVCAFLLADSSKQELQVHILKEKRDPGEVPLTLSLKDESSLSAQVFKTAKTKIISNFNEASLSGDGIEFEEEIHSLMVVPLRFGTEVLGVLKLGSREPNAFNFYHEGLTQLIAERTAAIIHNARLYEKLVQTNQELEKASQVKTEFVSIVSHELKTPVTALKGALNLVLGGEAGSLTQHQTHLLKIANNSTERLLFLISDLLDISRIEAGRIRLKIASLSLNAILKETEEIYHSSMDIKHFQFSMKISGKLLQVLGDEFRVKQVIDNLLTNAMKFTPPNGSITLNAENYGDFVMVSVTDTGLGINPEDQKKIFEKFYQVDSSLSRVAKGTGLGLAISKSIVEMQGGRIWVESALGKGSTFRFLLPKVKERSP